jgi:hypothetical protein
MKRRLWSARLLVGTLAAGGLLATHVPVSKAECNWGIIYLTRKNAESIPVWGPGCIVPVDSLNPVTRETESASTSGVPDGTPNGYFYDIIVAAP